MNDIDSSSFDKKIVSIFFRRFHFSWIIILLLIIFILTFFIAERITPNERIDSTIIRLSFRIHNYLKLHGKLPENLHVLPLDRGYTNSIKDGWGREIGYDITKNNEVVLTSLGKDGKAGGTGENMDIVVQYDPNKDGWEFEVADIIFHVKE
jgi:hypothetical protein